MNDVIATKRLGIRFKKHEAEGIFMGRIIKWLFYLLVLGAIALVIYAYVGPFFGADFSPPQTEIIVPVDLDAK